MLTLAQLQALHRVSVRWWGGSRPRVVRALQFWTGVALWRLAALLPRSR